MPPKKRKEGEEALPLFKEGNYPDPQALAVDIITGFSFPGTVDPGGRTRNISTLCNEPPTSIEWQTENNGEEKVRRRQLLQTFGVTSQPLDYSLLPQEMATIIQKKGLPAFLFCLKHLGFSTKSGTGLEHSDDFSGFRERQISLLKFLNDRANDNPVYIKSFLETKVKIKIVEEGKEVEREEPITNFIRQDPATIAKELPLGVLKGTQYFYRICYNDKANVWALCSGCNSEKGAKDFLEWAKCVPALGQPFIDAIQAAGGIHQGVILKRIYQHPNPAEIGYESEIPDSDPIHLLPLGVRVMGLGEFILEWFLDRNQKAFTAFKKFYESVEGDITKQFQTAVTAESKKVREDYAHRLKISHLILEQALEALKSSPEILLISSKKTKESEPVSDPMGTAPMAEDGPQAADGKSEGSTQELLERVFSLNAAETFNEVIEYSHLKDAIRQKYHEASKMIFIPLITHFAEDPKIHLHLSHSNYQIISTSLISFINREPPPSLDQAITKFKQLAAQEIQSVMKSLTDYSEKMLGVPLLPPGSAMHPAPHAQADFPSAPSHLPAPPVAVVAAPLPPSSPRHRSKSAPATLEWVNPAVRGKTGKAESPKLREGPTAPAVSSA